MSKITVICTETRIQTYPPNSIENRADWTVILCLPSQLLAPFSQGLCENNLGASLLAKGSLLGVGFLDISLRYFLN